MKYGIPLIATSLVLACGAAAATEFGTVVSSTPVTAQFQLPTQQCTDHQTVVQQAPTGAGSLLGAVVGGVVGNAFGHGAGRAAATGLGVVAGAVVGNNVEAANAPREDATVRSCQTVVGYQNRVIGYDVAYDYQGQRYTTRLAQPPGDRIALDVNVTPAGGQGVVAAAPTVVVPAPAPAVVYAPPVVYDAYRAPVVTVVPRVVLGGYWHRGY